MLRLLTGLVVGIATLTALAERVGMTPPTQWTADWIAPADGAREKYGVYLFRQSFRVDKIPASLPIQITADQRYRLFVNGVEMSTGPCRGDLHHWRYETVDIAKPLVTGANVVAVVVWNFAEHSPAAQIYSRPALRIEAVATEWKLLNTSGAWRVLNCQAYQPRLVDRQKEIPYYFVVGPGERFDGARFPWDWLAASFDDADWPHATVLRPDECAWNLVPRELPPLERRRDRFAAVRRAQGVDVPEEFLRGERPVVIPAHTQVTLLFDLGVETNAYPELAVTGGRDSTITLKYAESLWNDLSHVEPGSPAHRLQPGKGNRNEVEGKVMVGSSDQFLTDGGPNRHFRPLWFRTFRYLQLEIGTAGEPLTINDLTAEFTGYPMVEHAWFRSSDPGLSKLWDVGWRTLRLCAHETYFDCPYYEQLQYVGDTRIQADFGRYLSGDDTLARRAIQDFYDSIASAETSSTIDGYDATAAAGLTLSRYPCSQAQSIPPYSLYWISMLHDDWQWRGEAEFSGRYLKGVESVLAWHEKYLHPSGMLGETPGWRFVDWSLPQPPHKGRGGVPVCDAEGRNALLSLQLADTFVQAADLMELAGRSAEAERYRRSAQALREATMKLCWNAERGLVADSPDQQSYSQHANVLAILTNAIPQADQATVLDRLLTDTDICETTVYFQYYLNRALDHVGQGGRYLDTLQPWQTMLDLGLTTFAEKPEPSRSDCHGWSASPGYELLRTVAGIEPAEPGFRAVRVAPQLGRLTTIDAGVPTPQGTVAVKLTRVGSQGVAGTVSLPPATTGTFHWNEATIKLAPGVNAISIAALP